MNPIRKSPEPAALLQARQDGASWNEGFRGKAEVKRALVHDQRGICAYCERVLNAQKAEIEHFHPRSIDVCVDTENQPDDGHWGLTWSNLFASCPSPKLDRHSLKLEKIRSCNSVKHDNDWCDRLLHPTVARWPEGFVWTVHRVAPDRVELGSIIPLGESTLELLQLNRPGLARLRGEAWRNLEEQVADVGVETAIEIYRAGSPEFVTTAAAALGLEVAALR